MTEQKRTSRQEKEKAMTARSTSIVPRNHTAEDLTLTSTDLVGREWTQKPPEIAASALERSAAPHSMNFGSSKHSFRYVRGDAY